ncbi:MAG: hypothetical protein P8Y00_06125 [Deltaproteobacteria bacterium]
MEDISSAKDIKKLIADNNRLRSGLEKLEQDQARWAPRDEERDLKEIATVLKQMEGDVSVMLSDCIALVGQHEGNGIGQNLRQAYACLDVLFEDLKNARNHLEMTYIPSEEVKQMRIDWGRLKKTVAEIAHHLEC